METEFLRMQLKSKSREEFDFRKDFYLAWLLHTEAQVKEYYVSARKQSCVEPIPAMFPDVQLNYTENKTIIYLVPEK